MVSTMKFGSRSYDTIDYDIPFVHNACVVFPQDAVTGPSDSVETHTTGDLCHEHADPL